MANKRRNMSLFQPTVPDMSGPQNLLRAAPGLAKYVAEAGLHAAEWSVGTWFHGATRLLRAAAEGQPPAELLNATREEITEYGRQLLGIADIEARLWRVIAPEAGALGAHTNGDSEGSEAALRSRGDELLRRSADVNFVEDSHPAYARILSELAPDEGRILRFLATEGPQPAVDVRTSRPLNMATQMIGPGLSMIGVQAGCRRPDRVPAYLNNLFRLGLVWFSREPVKDALRYQVLEVQPDVVAAKHTAGRAKTIRRSIELTHFGKDFCEMCLGAVLRDGAGETSMPKLLNST